MYLNDYSINTLPYGQGMTTIPGPNDDCNGTSSGGVQTWLEGCLWQYVDNVGVVTMYMCIYTAPGAARWKAL